MVCRTGLFLVLTRELLKIQLSLTRTAPKYTLLLPTSSKNSAADLVLLLILINYIDIKCILNIYKIKLF